MNNQKKLIAVYGTLRKNASRNHNFGRFGEQTYINECWVGGYAMYDLGPYPCVIPSPKSSVFVEIHEVEPDVYRRLCMMEESAGYRCDDVVVVDNRDLMVTATIFVMRAKAVLDAIERGLAERIRSGDWNDPNGN